MFTRRTISKKIALAFTMLGLLLLSVNTWSFTYSRGINTTVGSIVSEDTPRVSALFEMQNVVYQIETLSERYRKEGMSSIERVNIKNLLLSLLDKINIQFLEYRKLLSEDHGKNFHTELLPLKDQLITTTVDMVQLREAGDATGADAKARLLGNVMGQTHETVTKAIRYELAHQQIEKEKAEVLLSTVALVNTVSSIIVLCTLVLLGFYLTRSVSRPLYRLEGALAEAAKGNFKQHVSIESQDEIGALSVAFNTMLDKIQESREQLDHRANELEEAQTFSEQKLNEMEKLNKLMVHRELRMIELKEEIARLKGGAVQSSETQDKNIS